MKIVEKTELNGYLTIYKDFNNGVREYVIKDDPNTITLASRRTHLQYLYDHANTPIDELATFRVGNGGAVGDDTQGNNNVVVLTPDPKRNDLFSPIALDNQNMNIHPSDPLDQTQVYLQILFTLTQDDANGHQINECGIFKDSGNMFNHKTFINIEKSEAFSLVFDWKLRYV